MNFAPSSARRGFTLIELLVVIAIIGILSAVVLASLNTARNKGADAAVKSNIETIRTQAELFYDNNSNRYNTNGTSAATGSCATANTMFAADTTISNALTQAGTAGGGTAVCHMNAAGSAYAVAAPLKTLSGTATQYYCIDSTGNAKTTTTALTTTTCP
ncbi:MAG TPA: type II secretion system protein [Candidatus Paceibacterota bacterium]|nr:type II secretion system protein [Candidatus Paceibacterota bacterium]